MSTASARETELLEKAYGYVLEHGLSEMSLRPLAGAIGSSPRVLLFLFDSKDELVRRLLARARQDELALLSADSGHDLVDTARLVWTWLADPAHAPLLRLWVEAYGRSLLEPDGPWGPFAEQTVADWLAVLAAAQVSGVRRTARGRDQRTHVLALLRGALLDLLATGDRHRLDRAVDAAITAFAPSG